MNPRERILAMTLAGVFVVVGGFFLLFKPLYLDGLKERDASIARLDKEIQERKLRLQQVLNDRKKLDRYRQLSLPSVPDDPNLPQREYEKFLGDLLRQSGFSTEGTRVTAENADVNSSPKLGPKKEPIYTLLPFKVVAQGDLASLVAALERFYRSGLLHRIKTVSIQRPLTMSSASQQRPGALDINLTVEAVILNGANSRPFLLPSLDRRLDRRLLWVDVVTALRQGPPGLALAAWAAGPTGPLGPRNLARSPQQYEAMASKNIFMAPVLVARDDVEATQFVHLTAISRDEKRSEAFLYDRYNNRYFRLRAETGFDSFRLLDNEGEPVFRGKVIQIKEQDLIFRSLADENYYSIHVGQSLQDALRPDKRLTEEQVKALGLAAAPDKLSSGDSQ
jgi:hypothetical protein